MFAKAAYHTVLPALPPAGGLADLAGEVFRRVFRRDFGAPGFALVSLGTSVSSVALRRFMVGLKEALGELYRRECGRHLGYLSLARFNQQVTTRFHLDGSPDEAYLMLGYEPSAVTSELAMADYTRAAHDWGIEPRTLLTDYNPMFADHERRLAPYVTRLSGFDPGGSHVLLVNNSSLPYRPDRAHTLGVLHQATIRSPSPERSRVVNSTLIGSAGEPVTDAASRALEDAFVATDEVAGEGRRSPGG